MFTFIISCKCTRMFMWIYFSVYTYLCVRAYAWVCIYICVCVFRNIQSIVICYTTTMIYALVSVLYVWRTNPQNILQNVSRENFLSFNGLDFSLKIFSDLYCRFKSMTIVLVYEALKTYCLTASYLYMCIHKVELFSGHKMSLNSFCLLNKRL